VSALRPLLRAGSLALCLAGVALVAQGAAVPVTAELAQAGLDREFERSLGELAGPLPVVAGHATRPAIATAAMPLAPARPDARPLAVAAGKPLARIAVKRLEVQEVVLAGPASHDGLSRGPAMVKRGDAASPVTVVSAHRDTHFLFIRDLREGDIVAMEYVDGTAETYRVTWFQTVRWNAFTYPLDPPRPLLALTTCYPFGGTEYGGPWRRVAWAERVG